MYYLYIPALRAALPRSRKKILIFEDASKGFEHQVNI